MITLRKIHADNELLRLLSDQQDDEIYEILDGLADVDLKIVQDQLHQLLDIVDEVHDDRIKIQGRTVNP